MAEITKGEYERRKEYADWDSFVTGDTDEIDSLLAERQIGWQLIAKNKEIVTLGTPMLLITKTGGEQFYIRLHRDPVRYFECDYMDGLISCLRDILL